MKDPATIKIQRLNNANPDTVQRLNKLFKQMHGKSEELSVVGLADHLCNSTIFVAIDSAENDMIVGIAILARSYCVSHKDCLIRNIVIDHDYRSHELTICKMLAEQIRNAAIASNFDTFHAHVNTNRSELIQVLMELGFEPRDYVTLRFPLAKARKALAA